MSRPVVPSSVRGNFVVSASFGCPSFVVASGRFVGATVKGSPLVVASGTLAGTCVTDSAFVVASMVVASVNVLPLVVASGLRVDESVTTESSFVVARRSFVVASVKGSPFGATVENIPVSVEVSVIEAVNLAVVVRDATFEDASLVASGASVVEDGLALVLTPSLFVSGPRNVVGGSAVSSVAVVTSVGVVVGFGFGVCLSLAVVSLA